MIPANVLEGATVYQFVSKKWGGPTRLVPLASITIGTTPSRITQNNPRRFENVVLNPSVAQVNVGFDPSITATSGIVVPALGGSVALSADEDGELVTYEVWAIAGQAGVVIWTYEVVRI